MTADLDAKPAVFVEEGVVRPDLVNTLEWLVGSPPNKHEFEEPPVSDDFFFMCHGGDNFCAARRGNRPLGQYVDH